MSEPFNVMNVLTPKPPFDPKKKNQAVVFHPLLKPSTNKYERLFQKGVDRTVGTINNKKLNIKTDGTELTAKEMNLKI